MVFNWATVWVSVVVIFPVYAAANVPANAAAKSAVDPVNATL